MQTHFLYSIFSEQLLILRDYLRKNLQKQFIFPNTTEYGIPILFAKKPDNELRFCINYKEFNAKIKKNVYSLLLIGEILERFSIVKVFTKLDIRQIFHCIRIDSDLMDLTIFRTRYGQYKFQVFLFGLINGFSIFQRYINNTLFPFLGDFCIVYIDDILIYSDDSA